MLHVGSSRQHKVLQGTNQGNTPHRAKGVIIRLSEELFEKLSHMRYFLAALGAFGGLWYWASIKMAQELIAEQHGYVSETRTSNTAFNPTVVGSSANPDAVH